MSLQLEEFNYCPEVQALDALMDCCHCTRWAERMIDDRPFDGLPDLLEAAGDYWDGMEEADVLEAFSGHPKIGDLSKLKDKYASAEQGQVALTNPAVLEELVELNSQYLDRHGFIFIVCATGKSAEEMRALLLQRLLQTREQELKNGAREQGKITALRLRQLFAAEEEPLHSS